MIPKFARMGGTLRLLTILTMAMVIMSLSVGNIVQAQDDTERTFNVNTTEDIDDFERGDGRCDADPTTNGDQCTLRAAISEANQTDAKDTINIPAGDYRLTLGGGDGDLNTNGDLDVYKDVDIIGAGSQNTTINASDISSNFVFHIGAAAQSSTVITISDVRITGAAQDGVYIRPRFAHTLNLNNVVVSGNGERGVENDYLGTVNIDNSTISNNSLGGILNYGLMTITGSVIAENTGNTGIINGIKEVENFTYRGDLQIINSTIRDNIANNLNASRVGGGLRLDERTTTSIQSSLIIRNEAKDGAGLWVDRNVTISRSTIAANIASDKGGGLFFNVAVNDSGSIVITESTISENIANGDSLTLGETGGGGFFNNNANVLIENSTISNNFTAQDGGGFLHTPGNAAERVNAKTVLNNVTIRGNRAAAVGGGFYAESLATQPVLISNTIISGNDGQQGGQECWDEGQNAVISVGYNIIADDVDCTNFQFDNTTQIGAGANLAPLAANGGPTCTHAIQLPSQAVDRGAPPSQTGNGTCTPNDQRGGERPADGDGNNEAVCDIGAVEYNASNVDPVPVGTECLFGNEVPVANEDSYTTPFNTPLVISSEAFGVLANDTDPDGDDLIALVQEAPQQGNLTAFDPDTGTFTYTPSIGATGEDSFVYVASDGIRESPFTTVTITIVEPVPVGNPDTYSVIPGEALTVNAANGVLANDTDPDGDSLVAELNNSVDSGSLSLNANGSFTYTPNNGFSGLDSFTYFAVDPNDNRSASTVVTLNVSDTQPSAVDDNYVTAQGVDLVVDRLNGVLSNDSDPNGDTLTASVVNDVDNGSLTLNQDGSFTYSPNGGFGGTDTFTYRANDGSENSNTATVTIEVRTNAPTAFNDTYNVQQGTTLTIATPGILQNDINPSGEPVTISVVTDVTRGTLNFEDDGSFDYTPNSGFTGVDQFTYEFSDGVLLSNRATVTINVTTEVVEPPVVNNDTYDVIQNTTLTVTSAQGVLANDTDPANLNLTASVVQQPVNGTLNLNANGGFTYTPNQDVVNITDQFTYRATNGTAESSTATVTLNIVEDDGGGGETTPVATNDTYSGTVGTSLTVDAASGVLANDTDPNDLDLSATKTSDPINGTVTLNADGSFTYTPNSNTFVGTDVFRYVANNGTEDSNEATVTINYASGNAPIANADSYTTPVDTNLVVTAAFGVLANDTSPTGSPLSATKTADPTNGTVLFNTDGSFTYTPTTGFTGTDTFTYTATDGTETSQVATVTITVGDTAGGDVPVANADSYTTAPDTALTVTSTQGVLANDTSPSGEALTATKVTDPTNGTVTLNTDGSFTYTPTAGFTGTDSFTYTASDSSGTSQAATVTIIVTASTGNVPVFTSPTGTITTLPVFVWTAVSGVSSYDLWIGRTGSRVFYDTISAADFCNGATCTVDVVQAFGNVTFANGTYFAYAWPSGTTQYSEPAIFTIQTSPTAPPTLQPLTSVDYSRPLVTWAAQSTHELWFNIIVVYTDAPSVVAANEWVYRYPACDENLQCSVRLPKDLVFNNISYSVYIGSWSPAGYSTSYQGPTNFTLNVPAPVAFSGLQAATDPTTNNRVFTWDHIPGVSWYQFWVGTLGPTRTYSSSWYLAFDQGCLDDGICSVEIPPSLLPAGAQFSWFVRGWSTAGFTTGEVAQHWVTGPNFTP